MTSAPPPLQRGRVTGAPRPQLSTPGLPNLRLAHGPVRCLCVSAAILLAGHFRTRMRVSRKKVPLAVLLESTWRSHTRRWSCQIYHCAEMKFVWWGCSSIAKKKCERAPLRPCLPSDPQCREPDKTQEGYYLQHGVLGVSEVSSTRLCLIKKSGLLTPGHSRP